MWNAELCTRSWWCHLASNSDKYRTRDWLCFILVRQVAPTVCQYSLGGDGGGHHVGVPAFLVIFVTLHGSCGVLVLAYASCEQVLQISPCHYLNNSVESEPILIVFAVQSYEEIWHVMKLFTTQKISPYYFVKCRPYLVCLIEVMYIGSQNVDALTKSRVLLYHNSQLKL